MAELQHRIQALEAELAALRKEKEEGQGAASEQSGTAPPVAIPVATPLKAGGTPVY